jgi:hypothetical protein
MASTIESDVARQSRRDESRKFSGSPRRLAPRDDGMNGFVQMCLWFSLRLCVSAFHDQFNWMRRPHGTGRLPLTSQMTG